MNRSSGSAADGLDMEVSLLRKIPLFRSMQEEQAKLLQPYFGFRQIAAGEELWHEGEDGQYLAFVLSGCMQLKKDTEFAGKQVVVGVFTYGAVIGELSFSSNNARVLTAAALEDCRLAVLTRPRFEDLINNHPALGALLLENVLQAVCKRLEKSYERLAAIF